MKGPLLALSLASGACGRHAASPEVPARTHADALARVREALVTGRPPLDSIADTRTLAYGRYLAQTVRIRQYADENPLTDQTWAVTLSDLEPSSAPQRALAPAVSWLGDGRCTRVREVPVPEDLRRLPATDPAWPEAGRRLRALVGERLRTLEAGEYRCGAGPVFRAHFFRNADGTYTVAALETPPQARPRP